MEAALGATNSLDAGSSLTQVWCLDHDWTHRLGQSEALKTLLRTFPLPC